MSRRPVLVLIPGLLCGMELWRDQIDRLVDMADCRVADVTSGGTREDLARIVLIQGRSRFALAGFSFGGLVAQVVMGLVPDRVDRLALLGTSTRSEAPERWAERMAMVAAARSPGQVDGITHRLLHRILHPDRLQDDALVQQIKAMAQLFGRKVFIRQSLVPRPDTTALLRTVCCPTLVLCGCQHRLTPVDVHREIASLIPGAQLQLLDRCGHMPSKEQPAAVTAALRD